MKIVFHGTNAATFRPDFERHLNRDCEISVLSDSLAGKQESLDFPAADVIIGTALSENHPVPERARLYQVAGAGYDGIDFSRVPPGCFVCNCHGHQQAISEYVMAAVLANYVPLVQADAELRKGNWPYMAGRPDGLRMECSALNIGIVGYGHIGRAVAQRAKAFDMIVHVANRSLIGENEPVDYYYPFTELDGFWEKADVLVIALPLTGETAGLVGRRAFERMRSDCLLINVGRGPVIDEQSLYTALKTKMIGGAVIDTWYVYPSGGKATAYPGNKPFQELDNLIATPHMSGWTWGTIRRRQSIMAENIRRLADGRKPLNIVAGN